MVLLCKQKALYVKCCIIANGITDSQGDNLNAEDIKKIFTSFNNQDNFELYHNEIPVTEVSLLENYITTADETIGTAIVPTGSWMAVIRVDNPEIKNKLLTNELQGVSLNNRIAEKCRGNLTGTVRYQDITDTECVIPLYISFVEHGANGYGLHVMDYDVYIRKSKSVKINDRSKNNMAFDLLGGLKKLVQQAEAEDEPVILKEDPQEEDEEEEVVDVDGSEEETTTTEEEDAAEIQKDDEAETDNDTDEVEIKKDDDTDEEFEAKVTAIVKKVIADLQAETSTEEVEEEEEEPVDKDTPKITKSSKVVITNEGQPVQTNYYDMTGRDPITGKKIR